MIKIAHIYSFQNAWFQVSGVRFQRPCSSFLTPETLRYGTKMGLKFHLYTRRFSPPHAGTKKN
ncbi:MAG: hypothetical protein DRH24_06095 [Deltaproteobacteria bacterium]|nr:MAG: hypothetical protein DRH24_06095 [Deltaproteobacteria bacterium]